MSLPPFKDLLKYAAGWNGLSPAHFYLTPAQEGVADWRVRVPPPSGDAPPLMLPVHSQTLALASTVFLGMLNEGVAPGTAPLAWDATTPVAALALLRLVYRPQELTPEIAGLLMDSCVMEGVVRLAHRYDVYLLSALTEAAAAPGPANLPRSALARLGALGEELNIEALRDLRLAATIEQVSSLKGGDEKKATELVAALGTSVELLQAGLVAALVNRTPSGKRKLDASSAGAAASLRTALGKAGEAPVDGVLFTFRLRNFQQRFASGEFCFGIKRSSAAVTVGGHRFCLQVLSANWRESPPPLGEAAFGVFLSMADPPPPGVKVRVAYALRVVNARKPRKSIDIAGTDDFHKDRLVWGRRGLVTVKTALECCDPAGDLVVQAVSVKVGAAAEGGDAGGGNAPPESAATAVAEPAAGH